MHGQGSATELLDDATAAELLAAECDGLPLDGKRVLVLIPDGTRNAPIPLLFRLLYEVLGKRVAQLDYLIALGTHPPMSESAVDRLVGVSAADRADRYPNVQIFNHAWDRADCPADDRLDHRAGSRAAHQRPAEPGDRGDAQSAHPRLRSADHLRPGVSARSGRLFRWRQVPLPRHRRARHHQRQSLAGRPGDQHANHRR